jgi:hypothetical protein
VSLKDVAHAQATYTVFYLVEIAAAPSRRRWRRA